MNERHTDVVNLLFAEGIIPEPRVIQRMYISSRDIFDARRMLVLSAAFAILAAVAVNSSSQTKPRTAKRKTVHSVGKVSKEAAPDPVITMAEPPKAELKKNGRPNGGPADPVHSEPSEKQKPPEYTYVFERPGFTYERIRIEHDDAGIGKITFKRSAFDEVITDPVSLSEKTMAKLRGAFDALDFLDSREEYQAARDYSHLGNIELTLRRGGRERTVRYNWSDNKNAKALMDEYRRISNEFIWRFEISLARENQPLQAPGLMEVLAGYLRRSEISDPKNLTPILSELSSDERLPLIARNRAAELKKQIEKAK